MVQKLSRVEDRPHHDLGQRFDQHRNLIGPFIALRVWPTADYLRLEQWALVIARRHASKPLRAREEMFPVHDDPKQGGHRPRPLGAHDRPREHRAEAKMAARPTTMTLNQRLIIV